MKCETNNLEGMTNKEREERIEELCIKIRKEFSIETEKNTLEESIHVMKTEYVQKGYKIKLANRLIKLMCEDQEMGEAIFIVCQIYGRIFFNRRIELGKMAKELEKLESEREK